VPRCTQDARIVNPPGWRVGTGTPGILPRVPTPAEIEAVLFDLADRLDEVDPSLRRAVIPDRRTVEAHLTDLAISFHAVLERGELGPILPGPPPERVDIRLAGTSADLLAMANGDLRFPRAYATGRVKVEASLADMIRFATVVPPR
jgi:hypothetical protein